MARTPISNLLGFPDTDQFVQDFPSLSIMKAAEVARETGQSIRDPGNLIDIFQSDTFQERMRDAAQGKREERALTRISQRSPTLPPPGVGTPTQQIEAGFRGREEALLGQIAGRRIFSQQRQRLQKQLQAVEFDRESFKRKRLREIDPVGDIDEQIFNIRDQALVFRANAWEQLSSIPVSQRLGIIDRGMSFFTTQIKGLQDARKARESATEEHIEREIDSKDSEVNRVNSMIDALEGRIDDMESIQGDKDAIAELRIELGKWKKKQAKGDGITTSQDLIFQQLLDEFTATHREAPDSNERAELKRQSRNIEEFRKRTKGRDVVAELIRTEEGEIEEVGPPPQRGIPLQPLTLEQRIEEGISRIPESELQKLVKKGVKRAT